MLKIKNTSKMKNYLFLLSIHFLCLKIVYEFSESASHEVLREKEKIQYLYTNILLTAN
jgi:hypothetical protein